MGGMSERAIVGNLTIVQKACESLTRIEWRIGGAFFSSQQNLVEMPATKGTDQNQPRPRYHFKVK